MEINLCFSECDSIRSLNFTLEQKKLFVLLLTVNMTSTRLRMKLTITSADQ